MYVHVCMYMYVRGQVTCAQRVGQQHAVQPAVDDSIAGSQRHAAPAHIHTYTAVNKDR